MSRKVVLMLGLLATVAATGLVTASGSFASDASRGDVYERIGHGGATYPLNATQAQGCQAARVEQSQGDVLERIGQGGSTYQVRPVQTTDCRVARVERSQGDVLERIGHGGSTYSSSRVMNN